MTYESQNARTGSRDRFTSFAMLRRTLQCRHRDTRQSTSQPRYKDQGEFVLSVPVVMHQKVIDHERKIMAAAP